MNIRTLSLISTVVAVALLASCDLLSPPQDSEDPAVPPGSQTPSTHTPPAIIAEAERFSIMPGPYYPFAQLENVVRDELGSEYQIADWSDLKLESDQLDQFLDAVGIEQGESYYVYWNGQAHPDKVAANSISAQHPGPAAFRYLAYRGPKRELDTHDEDLVIVDDSLNPLLVLYRTWNRTGEILVIQLP